MSSALSTQIRSDAAKKAWQTRRRLAVPTAVMLRWLEWLDRRPENVIAQRFDSHYGAIFNFGAFPETAISSSCYLHFTRGTFWAMQKRGWVEMFHRTPSRESGTSWRDGETTKHYSHTRYWRITDKGRAALAKART